MSPRAIFEIAVRIIGLLVIIASLLYLVYAVILFCNPYYPEPAIRYVFIGGLDFCLAGFYFAVLLSWCASHTDESQIQMARHRSNQSVKLTATRRTLTFTDD